MAFRSVTAAEVRQLEQQGCRAASWERVTVHPEIMLDRIRNVEFRGDVRLGDNRGAVKVDGIELACGVSNAILSDCEVHDNARIDRVGSVVARVTIGPGVVVQDVAALAADAGAVCGVGTELETVNEGGGRLVRLTAAMSAQSAYLQAFRRHDPAMTGAVEFAIAREVDLAKGRSVEIGAGAQVLHCGTIRNVRIGPSAIIRGASALEDGTILSCPEHPTTVGDGVSAKHFIIAEGAAVGSGVLLDKVFVGQAVKLGKQFSAENSLFFANA